MMKISAPMMSGFYAEVVEPTTLDPSAYEGVAVGDLGGRQIALTIRTERGVMLAAILSEAGINRLADLLAGIVERWSALDRDGTAPAPETVQ